MSGRNSLGELEELILLTVGVLDQDAYSVSIREELSKRQSRSISLGALHTALYRLERKGHLDSKLGEPTGKRGGKPKRYFAVTAQGQQILQQVNDNRLGLWRDIDPSTFSSIKFQK
ncbi:MAG: PadR family transcriptional regulator [Roseivirga sp.]|nr:PadR family transcriptional regulator [Roseivirga sp.]